MKPSSAKAKGRRFQQKIRDDLRELASPYGIEDGDCESRGMGQAGEDLILSPAFKRLLDLSIECKNVEKLDVGKTFFTHHEKYKNAPSLKILTHTKNRTAPLATLLWSDLLKLLKGTLPDVTKRSG